MNVVTKRKFLLNKKKYLSEIKRGAVFVYPTDTIYGIGCDATNTKSVMKIRRLKKRSKAPFSVAVPSKKWIRKNCVLTKSSEKWLKKLPGPYTLLLKLKNKQAVVNAVTNTTIIGVRMPNNWFAKVVKQLNIPIVSTSANITKNQHMTHLGNLDKSIKDKVDFIVYEGNKKSGPSKLITTDGKFKER